MMDLLCEKAPQEGGQGQADDGIVVYKTVREKRKNWSMGTLFLCLNNMWTRNYYSYPVLVKGRTGTKQQEWSPFQQLATERLPIKSQVDLIALIPPQNGLG